MDTISSTIEFVKTLSSDDHSGHDWWHVSRVYNLSKIIAEKETANMFLVRMAALLHDVDDWKLNKSNPFRAKEWLDQCGLETTIKDKILKIISEVSFRGSGEIIIPSSIEGKIVQDADRLDAMGAIGIARTFAYGGANQREIFNPEQAPAIHKTFEEYKTKQSHTINHFYEKLLLLKDLMNTETAKKLAAQRHQIMVSFLEDFYDEWNAGSEKQ
jgi:uncharacterized protein